jgi:hypothetical protein
MPVMPVRSSLEPTRYHTQLLIKGAVWISLSKTCKPFESRNLLAEVCMNTLRRKFFEEPKYSTSLGFEQPEC